MKWLPAKYKGNKVRKRLALVTHHIKSIVADFSLVIMVRECTEDKQNSPEFPCNLESSGHLLCSFLRCFYQLEQSFSLFETFTCTITNVLSLKFPSIFFWLFTFFLCFSIMSQASLPVLF